MPKTVEVINAKNLGVKKAELTAVLTRADGTVVDLGVIASTDYTLLGRIKNFFRKRG